MHWIVAVGTVEEASICDLCGCWSKTRWGSSTVLCGAQEWFPTFKAGHMVTLLQLPFMFFAG
jgi:hypothetical protein